MQELRAATSRLSMLVWSFVGTVTVLLCIALSSDLNSAPAPQLALLAATVTIVAAVTSIAVASLAGVGARRNQHVCQACSREDGATPAWLEIEVAHRPCRPRAPGRR